jgi:hypothetical protein
MANTDNITRTTTFLLAGIAAAFILNFIILENILIPDPCEFHGEETSFLFNLFYDTPGFNGGHPWPTNFYIILTIIMGGLLGYVTAKFVKRRSA